MRALYYDGKGDRRVPVPAWIELSLGTSSIAAECSRCGRAEAIGLEVKRDAERSLGRFALFHARCRDPEEIRRAVAAARNRADEGRRRTFDGAVPVIYVRRPVSGRMK